MEKAINREGVASPAEAPKRPWFGGRVTRYIKTKRVERKAKKEKETPQDRAARRTANATWLIGVLTAVLAGTGIYQFLVLGSQLDTMRKDQRPWIRVDLDGSYIQQNSDMFAIIHLLNKGKTPARRVQGDLFVERVKSGEEPKLDSPNPHIRISEGIQFPDIPSQFIPIKRVHSLEAGQVDPAPVSEAEFKDWFSGATYFVVYGTVSYADYYNVKHWTKFCVPLVAVPQSGDTNPKWIRFRKCTDYGDVDGN